MTRSFSWTHSGSNVFPGDGRDDVRAGKCRQDYGERSEKLQRLLSSLGGTRGWERYPPQDHSLSLRIVRALDRRQDLQRASDSRATEAVGQGVPRLAQQSLLRALEVHEDFDGVAWLGYHGRGRAPRRLEPRRSRTTCRLGLAASSLLLRPHAGARRLAASIGAGTVYRLPSAIARPRLDTRLHIVSTVPSEPGLMLAILAGGHWLRPRERFDTRGCRR